MEELRSEVAFRDKIIRKLESRILEHEETISRLRSDLDKYQSIMNRGLQKPRIRGQGISAEPVRSREHLEATKAVPKNQKTKELLEKAIGGNEFLCHLEASRVAELVEAMGREQFKKGAKILQEGAPGSTLYVLETGKCEVSREGRLLASLEPGTVFGELALLYDCKRTATITAGSDCVLWTCKRVAFQNAMMRSGLLRHEEYFEFLSSVPAFVQLGHEAVRRLADKIEEAEYGEGEFIVRQGNQGATFFIISRGKVRVTMKGPKDDEAKFIRTLGRGDFFGEKALTGDEVRTANIISEEDTVCLVLDRDAFTDSLASLDSVTHRYDDTPPTKAEIEWRKVKLTDLNVIATLGVGGFGRVDLVTLANDPSTSFALKTMKKAQIVATRQQEHIKSEKEIMLEARCPFVARLYTTFRDAKYLHMLMEPLLGGELWTVLRDRGHFDDITTRFYVACVLEAFAYLHARNVVYRDLKPENLILDTFGFAKITDFGFAKRLGGKKTWTFCGTPEYVAPEIILNKGHDTAADYWSLGVLIYELLTGTPPFTGADPMKTYNVILKGIEAIDFPRNVGQKAGHLIRKLCKDNPNERLGYSRGGIPDIQKHKWFDGFNYEGLRTRTLVPPIIPVVKGPADPGNFDEYPPDNDGVPPDDVSGWDEGF